MSEIEYTIEINPIDNYTIELNEQGPQGARGYTGPQGYSPIANVTKSGGVATITITDIYGTTTTNVYDGVGNISDVRVNGNSVVVDTIANITVPTDTSELTNNAGFITGITSTDVTTALGYTPYNSSNPNGYTSNIGTVTSVNNISPTDGNVTIMLPTNVSDLYNDEGYITSRDIEGKADTDLENITSSGYSMMAGASMPSDEYDDLTLGASGAGYIAPGNGYYTMEKIAGINNAHISMINFDNNLCLTVHVPTSGNVCRAYVPALKGQQVIISYDATGTTKCFRFIYAEGDK